MIRQMACGFIALAGITLLNASAVGQAPPPNRKELAKEYETRAATLTDPKEANAEWAKAVKEWTTLFQFAQAGLKNLPENAALADVKVAKNRFYEAYFEIQRVVVTANAQLVRDPVKFAEKAEATGKQIYALEKLHKFNEEKMVPVAGGKLVPIKLGVELMNPEVWTRYCDLLDKYPAVKQGYKDAGGKFFNERPKPE